ncbi:MAG TPA: hypothetical protein VJM09_03145 [Sphingobium sp.]|nr:hypothetical protein [Sphingobium sp.]
MLLILAAAAASAASPVYSAEIAHASAAYQASYHAESVVRVHEVEPRFATRPATPLCRWQAELIVNRAVSADGRPLAAVAKSIHRFAPLSGTHAGSCDAARGRIDADVARYSRDRSAEATSVAQRDRAVLLQELDGIHALSVKGG